MKRLIVLGMCLVLMLSTSSFAVLLNDFEGSGGSAVDWGGGQVPIDSDPDYSYDSSIGVTSGSQSLHLSNITGWAQTLSFKLWSTEITDFMANEKFTIDITAPANHQNDGSGGWIEIQQMTLNTEGYGWNDQLTSPVQLFYWDFSPDQTITLELDYSLAKASMPAVPGWVEIILATNSDGVHTDLYFDNAQLIVPEPATLSLLGLGAVLLRRKK